MRNNILVIDDNEDLLKITALILKSQGYNVFTASTLLQAAQQIEKEKPALLLLDVCICEEDGLLYCRQLKQTAATMDIRVILMSGHEYEKEAWNGADDFLFKPFDFAQLTQKVTAQLSAGLTAANTLPA